MQRDVTPHPDLSDAEDADPGDLMYMAAVVPDTCRTWPGQGLPAPGEGAGNATSCPLGCDGSGTP
jgi:hypothetical protein